MISDFLWIVLLLNLGRCSRRCSLSPWAFLRRCGITSSRTAFGRTELSATAEHAGEMRHLADLALPLLAFFAALLLLVNLLATLVHTSVIPLPIAAQAVNGIPPRSPEVEEPY